VLVDGQGGPLGVVIAGANVLERKMLRDTIEAIVVERPEPTAEEPQNLSLDGGYNNPAGRAATAEAGYIPHIHVGGEVVKPADRKPGYKPRRWVVERTLAWLSKCRGILVRYDKKDGNYLGLIQLPSALYWYRRLERLAQSDANQNPT
jgi:putative transposase